MSSSRATRSGVYPQAGGYSTGAAVGQATPNETYLGQRLLYEPVPEASFDPLSNTRYMLSMLRQASFFFVIYWILWDVFALIFGIVAFQQESSAIQNNGTPGIPGAVEVWAFGAGLAALAFIILFLVIPIPVVLSEWKFLVDDKAAARPVVFEHVTYAFRRRNTPVDSLGVRRLSLPGGVTRDYLEITRGVFSGYISCFEEGNDLYVGWTFWLRMPPYRWFLLRLERIWHEVTQRANELFVTLRYESAKAMREAMHSAAREGIDVAAGRVEAEGRGIVATLSVAASEVGR